MLLGSVTIVNMVSLPDVRGSIGLRVLNIYPKAEIGASTVLRCQVEPPEVANLVEMLGWEWNSNVGKFISQFSREKMFFFFSARQLTALSNEMAPDHLLF
jgi:hypothetical protein